MSDVFIQHGVGHASDSDQGEAVHPSQTDSNSMISRIHQAKSGSRQVMGELFGQFRQYLLLIANQNLPASISSKVGASDVVQETFIEACKIMPRFQGETPAQLRAWLAAILRFKIGQARRYYAGTDQRNVALEVPLEDFSQDNFFTDERGSTWIAQHANQLAQLHLALERLPADYRLAIELRSLQKLPFTELAKRSQRSLDAAYKLWMRAVRCLQRELTQSSFHLSPTDDYGKQPSHT